MNINTLLENHFVEITSCNRFGILEIILLYIAVYYNSVFLLNCFNSTIMQYIYRYFSNNTILLVP